MSESGTGVQLWWGAGVATGDSRHVSRNTGSTVSLGHTKEVTSNQEPPGSVKQEYWGDESSHSWGTTCAGAQVGQRSPGRCQLWAENGSWTVEGRFRQSRKAGRKLSCGCVRAQTESQIQGGHCF